MPLYLLLRLFLQILGGVQVLLKVREAASYVLFEFVNVVGPPGLIVDVVVGIHIFGR